MRLRAELLRVLVMAVFPIVGCNPVGTPTTAPLTLFISGVSLEGGPPGALKDVQLCETGTTDCALSNDNGQVTIELPIGETSYTLQKEGYGSYLVGDVMPANGQEYEFAMGLEQFFVEQHDRLMSPWPMRDTGTVQLTGVWAGTTLELFGATGTAYYAHENGEWRPWPDLTATTGRGVGGFVGVGPGNFQINLGGTAMDCVRALGWPGGVANSIRFPVQQGFITVASATCAIPSTVQLFVVVNEAVEGLGDIYTGPRLEGVEVCETDTINCAATDTNGEARLLVRASDEISYTMIKDGYVPYLSGLVTGNTSLGFGVRSFMLSDAQMEALAEDLGIPYPLTGGIVALRAGAPRMAGVTYALADGSAVRYYVDEARAVRLDLTATTSRGDGGLLEVTPGVRQIDFGGTATNCNVGRAWPGDAVNRIRVLVKVGHITYGQMWSCDEP